MLSWNGLEAGTITATLIQDDGTPITLKYVYKDASDYGKYAEIVVSVSAKTTLQYDGMTPYILESNAYSKVTMKAYGRLNTDYTAITKIQGPRLSPSSWFDIVAWISTFRHTPNFHHQVTVQHSNRQRPIPESNP